MVSALMIVVIWTLYFLIVPWHLKRFLRREIAYQGGQKCVAISMMC